MITDWCSTILTRQTTARWFINPDDLREISLEDGHWVDITSHFEGKTRNAYRLRSVRLRRRLNSSEDSACIWARHSSRSESDAANRESRGRPLSESGSMLRQGISCTLKH
jgi:hypothetical protein